MVGRSVWLWEWNVSTLSSRFCPERCARLFSMIRSVREERLQDITEEDAKREGVQAREGTPGWSVFTEDGTAYWRAGDEPPVRGVDCVRDFVRSEPLFGATAMEVFCALWNELHPKAPWQANPHLSRIELGPNLTREDAERLAAIKDPAERLEVGKRWKRETESRQETEALAP